MLILSTPSYCVECDCGHYFEHDIDWFSHATLACPQYGKEWTHKAAVPGTQAYLFQDDPEAQ